MLWKELERWSEVLGFLALLSPSLFSVPRGSSLLLSLSFSPRDSIDDTSSCCPHSLPAICLHCTHASEARKGNRKREGERERSDCLTNYSLQGFRRTATTTRTGDRALCLLEIREDRGSNTAANRGDLATSCVSVCVLLKARRNADSNSNNNAYKLQL